MRPSCGRAVEVDGVLVERAAALRARARPRARCFLATDLLFGALGQAMRDVLRDVEARDLVPVQQEHGMALLLAEDGDQHVGHAHFAAPAGLHLEHRPLQHALEAQRGLHLALVLARLDARGGLVDVPPQFFGQAPHVGAAGLEDLAHPRRVEDGQQQVLDRQEFVAGLARLREGTVQTGFKFG